MKRCPQCNRLETDDALSFCRVDGAPLVNDSGPVVSEAGTIRLPSGPVVNETSRLTRALPDPNTTIERTAAPTTVLPDAANSGTHQLTNQKRRWPIIVIAAVLVVIVLATTALYLKRKSGPAISSIAVLPFVNESGNTDVEYLSDGMTETLISSLSQLPNLNVKARSSVFRYKGKETNPQTIGRELNVQAILNGRVSQRGDQLTLSLELINAQTENVIWSEQYDRKQSDLVMLQREIARDVSSKLKTKLSGTDEQKLVKTYTANPEAYRMYLQGRFYWDKREEKDLKRAIEFFSQAIALDPNYALAYAGLADSHLLLASFGFAPTEQKVPIAREYARKALSLEESLAEPHTALGLAALQYDYDFVESEREYKRAIALNPNYATAHQWYGEMLSCAGRFEEASTEFNRALELEPLSLPINWDYGRLLYHWRKYDESLAQYKKTIDLDPNFGRVRRTLVELYRSKGEYANAIEELAKYFEVRGQPENAVLVRETFKKDGWNGYLRLVVQENSPMKERPWILAKAWLELGDKDKAWAELNNAYENHDSNLAWLKVEPQFDPLRSDPRFQGLLKKMRFP